VRRNDVRIRITLGAIASFACAACGHGEPAPEAPRVAARAALPADAAIDAPADAATDAAIACSRPGPALAVADMRATISALAAPELGGRVPGSDGDRTARALIADALRCAQLVPAGDHGSYEQAFTSHDGAKTANLIGVAPGDDPTHGDDIVLITAHHDHLGAGHLGANDNASGTAALLAIARSLGKHPIAHGRTIAFAVFGDEEAGMIGSAYFAAHPSPQVPLDHVVQVINLDMVGSYRDAGFVAAMGTFPHLAARDALAQLARATPKLSVALGGKARGSDFAPFCELGVPYVFFWTPDPRCYHERCDTADRVDVPHAVAIAALARDLAVSLATSSQDLLALRTRFGCFGHAH